VGRNNADFFHGSDHPFKPGDVIEPNHDPKNKGQPGIVWASTNRDVAASYGSKVYRVAPVGDDVKRQPGAGKEFGIHNSRTGFKVLGEG
jgi:hypothetical protein